MARKSKAPLQSQPEIYKDTMTYKCPVRGLVSQLVDIKRYPKQEAPIYQPKYTIADEINISDDEELE
jgi:hypothetical protein